MDNNMDYTDIHDEHLLSKDTKITEKDIFLNNQETNGEFQSTSENKNEMECSREGVSNLENLGNIKSGDYMKKNHSNSDPEHRNRNSMSMDPLELIERLNSEIIYLKNKLKCMEGFVENMKEERDALSREIADMSGCLFEESNKCIQSIYSSKQQVELQLRESKQNELIMKLQNQDLKKIIRNSKFDLLPFSKKSKSSTPTHFSNFKKFKENRTTDSSDDSHLKCILNTPIKYKFNDIYFEQFTSWLEEGCPSDGAFFKTILNVETIPCLTFPNIQLQEIARNYMINWETIPSIVPASDYNKKVCDFMFIPCETSYRVSFNSSDQYVACPLVRAMLISITELYKYINYISIKLVKISPQEMFNQIIRLRLQVTMSRLGFCPDI